jgi:hypothetical protein
VEVEQVQEQVEAAVVVVVVVGQLEPVEGQIGAVDGLLRFRTCVSSAIACRGTAQHGAARPVRAA